MTELGDRDRAILDFEARYYRYAGAKEQAIRDTFDMTATRYYQVLNAILERPEALEYKPQLVKRLLRISRRNQATRTARSVAR